MTGTTANTPNRHSLYGQIEDARAVEVGELLCPKSQDVVGQGQYHLQ